MYHKTPTLKTEGYGTVLVLRSAWTPNWRRSCSTWTLPPATVHQYQHRLEPTYDKDDVLLLLLVVLSTQYQLDPDDPDILTNIVCVTSTRNTSTAVQYQTCATPSWILYSRLTVLEWYYIVPAGGRTPGNSLVLRPFRSSNAGTVTTTCNLYSTLYKYLVLQ